MPLNLVPGGDAGGDAGGEAGVSMSGEAGGEAGVSTSPPSAPSVGDIGDSKTGPPLFSGSRDDSRPPKRLWSPRSSGGNRWSNL